MSLLLRWGLECCIRDSIAADLDSAADAGSLYARHGFEVAERLSMALEGVDVGPVVVYEKTFFMLSNWYDKGQLEEREAKSR